MLQFRLLSMAMAFAALVGVTHAAHEVRLSNVALPRDQSGRALITGEASVLFYGGAYYFYFNDWGSCPGVNCCNSSAGCATCCFDKPPHPYAPGCESTSNGSNPYGVYHVIRAYRSENLLDFQDLGVVLDLDHRPPGVVFRPHVIFNQLTQKFVMWFEDRSSTNHSYQVATSDRPDGMFNTIRTNILMAVTADHEMDFPMPGKGRIGDYNLFVDDNLTAYHIRTGFDIVALNEDYTGPARLVSSFQTKQNAEAPVLFKREGRYYAIVGSDCCACFGGASMLVYEAPSLAGPWTFQSDIGSNPTPFDKHSPANYVTKAQGSSMMRVQAADGGDVYIWLGNQWNSGLLQTPPGPRNHDLLYWAKLSFNATGFILPLQYEEVTVFDMHSDDSQSEAAELVV